MYNIFCEEMANKKMNKKKAQNLKESSKESIFIAKKRKIECFSDSELNNDYLDKLKKHLYIDSYKNKNKDIKQTNDEFIIDLSSTEQTGEIINGKSLPFIKLVDSEKPNTNHKLRLPKMV